MGLSIRYIEERHHEWAREFARLLGCTPHPSHAKMVNAAMYTVAHEIAGSFEDGRHFHPILAMLNAATTAPQPPMNPHPGMTIRYIEESKQDWAEEFAGPGMYDCKPDTSHAVMIQGAMYRLAFHIADSFEGGRHFDGILEMLGATTEPAPKSRRKPNP